MPFSPAETPVVEADMYSRHSTVTERFGTVYYMWAELKNRRGNLFLNLTIYGSVSPKKCHRYSDITTENNSKINSCLPSLIFIC